MTSVVWCVRVRVVSGETTPDKVGSLSISDARRHARLCAQCPCWSVLLSCVDGLSSLLCCCHLSMLCGPGERCSLHSCFRLVALPCAHRARNMVTCPLSQCTAIAVYSNSLEGNFVFDDLEAVVKNADVDASKTSMPRGLARCTTAVTRVQASPRCSRTTSGVKAWPRRTRSTRQVSRRARGVADADRSRTGPSPC